MGRVALDRQTIVDFTEADVYEQWHVYGSGISWTMQVTSTLLQTDNLASTSCHFLPRELCSARYSDGAAAAVRRPRFHHQAFKRGSINRYSRTTVVVIYSAILGDQ